MEFEEVVGKRASCRSFEPTPVGKDVIAGIIGVGVRAPSPLNQQPWEFLVVMDRDVRARIHAVAVETKDRLLRDTGKSWLGKYDLNFLGEAPVLVVVLADPTKIGMGEHLGDRIAHVKAVSACIENMLLAATSRGLGSLWYTMFDAEGVRQVLGIGKDRDIVGIIPLGYPAAPPQPTPRSGVETKITYVE